MSTPEDGKGPGRGRGKYTAAGVQAQQRADIEAIKDIAVDLLRRVEALEAANDET